ncbi:ABC transporter permease [Paraglaciecola sp. 2405UD69-4]|uniref:ABC transporter permease n=1 Tax=Paraglaciecola sp. 2405UD69-4 TaxID=3391836 RepID=UPI0039C99A17
MQINNLVVRLSIGPIISTLLRHKYTVIMLVLQIAVAMAVLSNGLFIATERYKTIHTASGIDELNSFFLTSSGFSDDFNPRNSIQSDLALIRALPEVINAVKTDSFPYSNSGVEFSLSTHAKSQNGLAAASYKLDENGLEALGLELVAGQNFTKNQVVWQSENATRFSPYVLLTKRTAEALFNTNNWQSILGKPVFIEKNHIVTVIGIIDKLHAPWADWEHVEHSFITPSVVTHNSSRYFIRVKPGALQTMMNEIEHSLAAHNSSRVIRKVTSISDAKKQVYGPDLAALSILTVVMICLAVIVALGIMGATALKVLKQTKQIGIRRALGATQVDIMRYYLLETLIVTSVGVLLGGIIAVFLNIVLVEHYAFSQLPIDYLVAASVTMYFLSILATLKPTLKAIKISPVTATQSH